MSFTCVQNYTAAVGAMEPCEDDLLARLRAGDEIAFEELVRQHHRALRRLALSFVQTPAIADEVVQETGWR